MTDSSTAPMITAISATSETQSPATQAAPLAVTPTTGSAEGFAPPTPSRTPRLLRQVQVVAALVVGLITALGVWAVLDLRADVAAAPQGAGAFRFGFVPWGKVNRPLTISGAGLGRSHPREAVPMEPLVRHTVMM